MRINSSYIFKVGLILSVLLLSACQDEKEDLQSYVAKLKAQPRTGIDPLPAMKEQETFDYAANDLRDPFQPKVNEVVIDDAKNRVNGSGLRPDEDRLKEVLENFPLEELELVGTLEQDIIWGLIRTPEGTIYRVHTGNYIGQNEGLILNVSESEIELRELVLNGAGEYSERENLLSISTADEN